MEKPSCELHFERCLTEAVDEALSALGESPKHAVFFHLEKDFCIKRQDISDNIEAFDGALRRFFGIGASFLQILIMRKLCEKVGFSFSNSAFKDDDFVGAILCVRRWMEEAEFVERNAPKREEYPTRNALQESKVCDVAFVESELEGRISDLLFQSSFPLADSAGL